jgi:leucyl-tRNA synthetase
MGGTLKTIRDAEITLPKRMQKGKGGKDVLFDPKKPKVVWVYATTKFLEWQEMCV